MRRSAHLATTVAAAALAVAAPAVAAPPLPILEEPRSDEVETFVGSPATPRPLYAPVAPRHPFMAPNERSNLHEDAYMTDVHFGPAPLGREMQRVSTFLEGVCASITFDSRDRLVTICVGLEGPKLVMLDPQTLELLAAMALPSRSPGTGSIFTDFAGGGYFYLDDRDRAVIPTTSRHLYVVQVNEGGFALERDYDLTGAVPLGDKIISALPDWRGRLWFASIEGVVGTVDPDSGSVRPLALGEPIANSFSVDETGGVYVVSDAALYRLDAAADGAPTVSWREQYRNSGVSKPGQVHAGSGTTPSLMGQHWVAITDNADPMNVVVYRRRRELAGPRLVCEVPVFEPGRSATDNALVTTRKAILVENNYGYTGPAATAEGGVTEPGFERIDIDRDGRGCHRVWRSQEAAPTVVPKLSASNGLLYTYTKSDHEDDPWYLTAIDFETGRTTYKQLAGIGLGYNNNYAPLTFGPDGTAYLGMLGGMTALRDATPPPRFEPPPPRLGLRLRRRGRGGLIATLTGADRDRVERVALYVNGRRVARDTRPPFRRRVPRRGLSRRGRYLLQVRVLMLDGRVTALERRFRRDPPERRR